ncbi:MAG: 2-hydroxyglutaryl-CoA dehydratase [Peptococcaceae bacterium]|jgi:predicted CoA-substrate-specific enzyme activase|nr:2-hydroxyglutaryl-CoA dehydratase [Peptococcaceae bacterium]
MYIGIDLGSRSVKLALQEEDKAMWLEKFDTLQFYRDYGKRENGRLVVEAASMGLLAGSHSITATGYGRQAINVKGARVIPEIQAHVQGAAHLTGLADFTLLDLGGQDSKVGLVRQGKLVDFLTNDKCAASTGRYLENMAAALNISMEELSRHRREPAELTSTCAVFGESELIGLVVDGYSMESLAAGVNYSIFKRVKPMLAKLASDVIVFTGGVAQNSALVEIIREELGRKVLVPENPQFAGAIGCCVDAARHSKKQ